MQRGQFISLVGGAAAWPLAAQAQPHSPRRIGVISAISETDPEAKLRLMAFQQGLEELGWAKGRNPRIDFRWTNSGAVALADEMTALSRAIVALEPEVILVQSNPGGCGTTPGDLHDSRQRRISANGSIGCIVPGSDIDAG